MPSLRKRFLLLGHSAQYVNLVISQLGTDHAKPLSNARSRSCSGIIASQHGIYITIIPSFTGSEFNFPFFYIYDF